MNTNSNFNLEDKDDLNFKEYFFILLHNWYWLVIGLVVCLFLAWLQLRYATPVYEVSGTILIGDTKNQGITEQKLLTELGYEDNSLIEDQLQVLRSSILMQRVIDSLDLQNQYFLSGRIKTTEMYNPFKVRLVNNVSYEPNTFKIEVLSGNTFKLLVGKDSKENALVCKFEDTIRVNQQLIVLNPIKVVEANQEYTIILGNPETASRQYSSNLEIEQVKRANSINIGLMSPVPEKAIDLINTLVKEYNKSVIEEKNLAGKNTLNFIDERLKYIAEELYDVEKDVQQYKQENKLPVELGVSSSQFMSEVGDFDKQLLELEVRQSMVTNLAAFLDNPANRYASLPISSSILSESMRDIVKQYNELLFKRGNLLEAATESNPAVATFEEQLIYLYGNLKNSINNLQREIESQKRAIKSKLQPIENRISAVPRNERELLQIMRQQKIKETLFLFLLQKREETALSIAAQTSDARILDKPINKGPVYPNPTHIYLIAFVFGIGVPTGIIILIKLLNNKVYSKNDIENNTQIPFLGVIGEPKEDKGPIVVKKGSRSAVSEMFRLLRTNLQFNAAGSSGQVLMVTSSTSGEGKTFISMNLGIVQAQAGKKTLLIGLDLRKPKLVNYLTGERESTGITNYLVDPALDINTLIRKADFTDNLYFIGCGPIPPNPAELILQPYLHQLIDQLRTQFDIIIIDTAPVGLVTDALLLESIIDQTLVVLRYGITPKPFMTILNDLYTSKKLVRPGLVLNGVKSGSAYGYGNGYGYGYGYGYGNGYGYYEEDQKKKKNK